MSSNLVINTGIGTINSPAGIAENISTLYTAGQTITQTILLNPSGTAGSQYASPVGFSQITLNPSGTVILTAAKGSNPAYININVNQLTTIDDTVDTFQVTNPGTTTVAVNIVWIVQVSTSTPVPSIVTSVNGMTGAVVLSASSLTGLATVALTGNYYNLLNLPNLAPVATTGLYSSLTGLPTIPQAPVNADWNATNGLAQILNKPTLAVVATTGSYASLLNLPNFAVVATSGNYDDLNNRPTLAAVATSGAYADLVGRPALATVALSGSYTDLLNKPAPYTLPPASSTVLGGVKISSTSGLVVSGSGSLSLGVATPTQLGGVKQGFGNIIGADGTLTITSTYALPPATTSTLGGVIVGAGLTVTDGTISISSSDLQTNLTAWALVGAFRLAGAVTRNANSALLSANITWPDGTAGVYTADVVDTPNPSLVDAWHATYEGSSHTYTVTQPLVTRDSNGAITVQPAITIF
jgi:hypothetical protein